jgi:hypothetical protein
MRERRREERAGLETTNGLRYGLLGPGGFDATRTLPAPGSERRERLYMEEKDIAGCCTVSRPLRAVLSCVRVNLRLLRSLRKSQAAWRFGHMAKHTTRRCFKHATNCFQGHRKVGML